MSVIFKKIFLSEPPPNLPMFPRAYISIPSLRAHGILGVSVNLHYR